jgi:hypothetical protein
MWLSQAKSKRGCDGNGMGETLHVAESRVLSKVPISPLSDDLRGAQRWEIERGGKGIKDFGSDHIREPKARGREGGRAFMNQHDSPMAMSSCKLSACVGQGNNNIQSVRTGRP